MLKLKSPPNHNFALAILLASEVNPEWLLGKITDDGKFIQNEIECTIDEKQAMIKLIDQWKMKISELSLADAILQLGLGLTSQTVKAVLNKKHPGLKPETEVRLIIYQLMEVA